MQAVNASGVPVMITNQPGGFIQDKRLPFINMSNGVAKGLMVLGSLQIVFGILVMGFNAVGLSKWHNAEFFVFSTAFIGHGIWMGIVFIVTGAFGIVGGIRKIRWTVLTFNILSIISASLTALMLIICVTAAYIGFRIYNDEYRRYYSRSNDAYYGLNSYRPNYDRIEVQRIMAIMETLMAVVAVLEGITAICSSVVCCALGTCCCDCGCDGQGCCPSYSNNSTVDMVTGQEHRSPLQQFAMLDMANRSETATTTNQQPNYYNTYVQLNEAQYQQIA